MTKQKKRRGAAQTATLSSVLQKNQILDAEIIDMNLLGHGIAKVNGVAVFVTGGVTGDRLRIKIIKLCNRYAVARIEEIYTPSPHRIPPTCALHKRCGGCVLRHISYTHELELKTRAIKELLHRAGVETEVLPAIGSPQVDGYRNKVQLPIDENYNMGFFVAHSHDIVACSACDLTMPPLMEIARTVRDHLAAHQIKGVRHIYLRAGKQTGEVLVCLVTWKDSFTAEEAKGLCDILHNSHVEIVGVLQNINDRETNVILGDTYRTLWGKDTLTDELCGCTFTVAAPAFYQVNHDAAELLYQRVAALANLQAGETLVDLYCGAGTIGLSVIRGLPEAKLVGVEIVPEAVENARRNAVANGVTNATFYVGDADHSAVTEADVIVVDPPRKGCSRAVLDRLLAVAPKRIVYVSCGPDTLARDLAYLIEGGYTCGAVQPVDLFPRTGHVETIVCLNKQ